LSQQLSDCTNMQIADHAYILITIANADIVFNVFICVTKTETCVSKLKCGSGDMSFSVEWTTICNVSQKMRHA